MQKFKLIYFFAFFSFIMPFSLLAYKHFNYDVFFKGKISDETKQQYLLLLKKVKNNKEFFITANANELKTALSLDLKRLKTEKCAKQNEKIFSLVSSCWGGTVAGLLVFSMVADAVVNNEFSIIDLGCGLIAIGLGLPSYFAYKHSQENRRLRKKEQKITEREKMLGILIQ